MINQRRYWRGHSWFKVNATSDRSKVMISSVMFFALWNSRVVNSNIFCLKGRWHLYQAWFKSVNMSLSLVIRGNTIRVQEPKDALDSTINIKLYYFIYIYWIIAYNTCSTFGTSRLIVNLRKCKNFSIIDQILYLL